jgi:hypothetical protein
MKKIITSLLLLISLQTLTFAQKKYRVFDGDGLNIQFWQDPSNNKLYDLFFTGYDANNKIVWKKTELLDVEQITLDNVSGYRYTVKDDKGLKYNVVYNRDLKYVNIHKLNNTGERTLMYKLYERNIQKKEEKSSIYDSRYVGKTAYVYNGQYKIKFNLAGDTDKITNFYVFYEASGYNAEGYRLISIKENEGGIGDEMYFIGKYGNDEFMIVYKPKSMSSVKLTVTNSSSKKSKDYTLRLESQTKINY